MQGHRAETGGLRTTISRPGGCPKTPCPFCQPDWRKESFYPQKMIPSVSHKDYTVTQLSKALVRFNKALESRGCCDLGSKSQELSVCESAPAVDIITAGTPHTRQGHVNPLRDNGRGGDEEGK